MRPRLKLHPDSICHAVTSIDVEVAVRRGGLTLSYIVSGDIGDIRWPSLANPARASGLWRHTCFELFVRASPDEAYYEFNFSPSRQWAAYRFTGYRSGMNDLAMPHAPVIDTGPDRGGYVLQVALESDCLPPVSRDAAWRLGLSAVIEEGNGRMSYWALAHPPARPDFHHCDGFALELSPAGHP
jgi:hypothetical protein